MITFLIVCLLQIQFRGKTIEKRLMTFVRSTLAPQILGRDDTLIDHSKYRLSPTEMANLKKKVFDSEALKGVRKSAKALFFKEMTNVMEESEEAKKKD